VQRRLVALHLGDGALGEDLAFVHDRDLVREATHEVHVVLDDEDRRAVLRDGRDELAGVETLLLRHPRYRLVEQQQPRPLDEHHRDLEPLLLAVRQ
jgi:hypothetical protein